MTKNETQELSDEEWAVVHAAVEEAINHLIDFRKQEGAALEKKVREKIENIARVLESVAPYAVSYTHLDVYKRQLSGVPDRRMRTEWAGAYPAFPTVLSLLRPQTAPCVSYTHLDVYKRQQCSGSFSV